MLAPPNSPITHKTYWTDLKFPLYLSPKLDGIRAVVRNGKVLSRTLKPIRSAQVQKLFGKFEGYDGELIVGHPCNPLVFNRTSSAVMSFGKDVEDLSYNIFDNCLDELSLLPYEYRLETLEIADNVNIVSQHRCNNIDEVLELEDRYLQEGYEGVMLRSPEGIYKHNRATWNDNIIIKLKRFEDAEGMVVDIEEGTVNQNEQELDERGYSKRSISKEGLVPSGMVGRFIVLFEGMLLSVPPGNFTHQERIEILHHKELYLGRPLKFRFTRTGMLLVPRFMRALGFRDD